MKNFLLGLIALLLITMLGVGVYMYLNPTTTDKVIEKVAHKEGTQGDTKTEENTESNTESDTAESVKYAPTHQEVYDKGTHGEDVNGLMDKEGHAWYMYGGSWGYVANGKVYDEDGSYIQEMQQPVTKDSLRSVGKSIESANSEDDTDFPELDAEGKPVGDDNTPRYSDESVSVENNPDYKGEIPDAE